MWWTNERKTLRKKKKKLTKDHFKVLNCFSFPFLICCFCVEWSLHSSVPLRLRLLDSIPDRCKSLWCLFRKKSGRLFLSAVPFKCYSVVFHCLILSQTDFKDFSPANFSNCCSCNKLEEQRVLESLRGNPIAKNSFSICVIVRSKRISVAWCSGFLKSEQHKAKDKSF